MRARDRGVSAPSILANELPWLPVMPWLEARVHPATQENKERDKCDVMTVTAVLVYKQGELCRIAPFWSYCRLNDLFLRYSTSQNLYFTNSPSRRREGEQIGEENKAESRKRFGY